MLARLAQVPCAASAEVDHGGRFLRLRARPDADPERCLDEVSRQLAASGVEVEPADDTGRREAEAVTRWYGPSSVQELSREEAERLGRELGASFARLVGLSPEAEVALVRTIARHFREAFIAHPLEPSAGAGVRLEPALAAIREEAATFIDRSLVPALEAHLRSEMEVKGDGDRG